MRNKIIDEILNEIPEHEHKLIGYEMNDFADQCEGVYIELPSTSVFGVMNPLFIIHGWNNVDGDLPFNLIQAISLRSDLDKFIKTYTNERTEVEL